MPGAVLSTFLVTAGWGILVLYRLDRYDLAHVRHRQSAPGRDRPVHRDDHADQQRPGQVRPVTLLPMLFVLTTTMSAGWLMVQNFPRP